MLTFRSTMVVVLWRVLFGVVKPRAVAFRRRVRRTEAQNPPRKRDGSGDIGFIRGLKHPLQDRIRIATIPPVWFRVRFVWRPQS